MSRGNGLRALFVAALCGVGPASAQSTSVAATPSELPPESFAGDQFVDSRGCVFVRIGVSGATEWVPRVARDRTLVCGFEPTRFGNEPAAAPVTEVEIEPEPASPTAAPVLEQAALPVKAAGTHPSPKTGKTTVPQEVVTIRCRKSIFGVMLASNDPRCFKARAAAAVPPTVAPMPKQAPPLPKGFVRAWDDDRLNPRRAQGTPEGWAQMRRVWTTSVPAELRGRFVKPTATANAGGYVQVATFRAGGSHAEATRAQLAGQGLAAGVIRSGPYDVVRIGPLADAAATADALTAARAAGFSDAFVRR